MRLVTCKFFCQDNYSKCYYLLQSLHGTADKHRGISKLMQEIRKKFYSPSIATYVRNWFRECEMWTKKLNIYTGTLSELIDILEGDLGKKDLMQFDLITELPPTGCYGIFITATDVFSKYAFVYPVSFPRAVETAKVNSNIMISYPYLPTLIKADKGSALSS